VGLLRIFFSSRLSVRVHLVLWLCLCTSVYVIWQVGVLLAVCPRRSWPAVGEWLVALELISALPRLRASSPSARA
jgi:hypothetical protein